MCGDLTGSLAKAGRSLGHQNNKRKRHEKGQAETKRNWFIPYHPRGGRDAVIICLLISCSTLNMTEPSQMRQMPAQPKLKKQKLHLRRLRKPPD